MVKKGKAMDEQVKVEVVYGEVKAVGEELKQEDGRQDVNIFAPSLGIASKQ